MRPYLYDWVRTKKRIVKNEKLNVYTEYLYGNISC